MIKDLEQQRNENLKNLLNALNITLDVEPLICINENEEEIYAICNDLKSYLEEFLTQ